MNNIAVSIIVPIYNKEKYLKECLDTIVNQTLHSIEIILIDDGSTDSSKKVCESYLKDGRVFYFYQENEGLASARQTGIENAHGEYIGFIDADDWIDLDMFEKMYNKAIEYNCDVVFCNRMYGDEEYRPPKDIPTGYYDRKRILSDILPKTLAFIGEKGSKSAISWSNCRRIFRKNFLDMNNIQFDRRFRRSQDLQLTYESMLYANSFFHMGDDYFYHVRRLPDSLSRGYTRNMWPLYVMLIERLYQDTETFKEINLMPQMHLRNFFFVIECIQNELKQSFPFNEKKRIELISEIINHPLSDRYYGKIDVKKLMPLYQKYYELIHKKKAKEIIRYTSYYWKKRQIRSKYIVPITDLITEGPVIGTIYKKIRKKSREDKD